MSACRAHLSACSRDASRGVHRQCVTRSLEPGCGLQSPALLRSRRTAETHGSQSPSRTASVRQERDATCSSLEDRELRGSALSLRSRRSEELYARCARRRKEGEGKDAPRYTFAYFIQSHYRVVTTLCPNQLSGPAHFRYFSLRYSI